MLLMGGGSELARAQPDPARGMVWTPPAQLEQAQQDLQRMKEIGVTAVRTGLIQREPLLTLADTLGLQLYQELPISYYPDARLRDSLGYARRLLDRALKQARGHPSARHFGLARRSETSDTTACPYFEELARRVHRRGPPGSQAYYLTAFVEKDRCAHTVDAVLLDALNLSEPVALLARWRQPPERPPGGIGALGTRRELGAPSGLRTAGSAERQARYLETALRGLLADTLSPPPTAVFVYRWRDVQASSSSPAYGLSGSAHYNYGLLGPEEEEQPVFDVVRGFYTGRQHVFAFESGSASPTSWPWLTLLAWGALLLLGSAYSFVPRLHRMMPRYFRTPGFYREAVREGGSALLTTASVLLVVLALSVGIMASASLQLVSEQNVFVLLLQRLPIVTPKVIVSLLPRPWLLALLIGGGFAALVISWAFVLSLLSRGYYVLSPVQTLVLVLWPRWMYLVLMIGALVIATLSAPTALFALLGLVACWGLVVIVATLRTAYDYQKVVRAPLWVSIVAVLVSPLTVLAAGVLALALVDWPNAEFLWHLATRAP